ncbi:NAD(P)/FAD-dependent oxidoreductase [Krasilnikoviella flava]|uniref:3-phenylpropionate/trans-cinnamate dioxygenase ferredoxin reductase subunit n=1 Tax=Krasilnikoviella flava TaxID=526729 RepID=A0A1T5IMZ6_9MICO|nr:FAD-dependent oxidoreductase [Krasilnikoviella flava]SKC40500.1 3-phenylpropionate/trans-cinnamate dioxygenase ferredoxin reductase subunit [Krasilnikoviella flava]
MPAPSTAPVLVVGGGLAAARAVEAVREQDDDVDVVVVTSEGHRPYERPPLSKAYLRGQAEPDVIYPLRAGWWDDHAIDLRTLTTVVDLAPGDHEVTFADGSTLGYSRLLLATGSTPRALQVPGRSLIGVHTLRTVDDADLLAGILLPASLEGEGKVVVVGDGWIGTEVAASARMLGLDVCLVGQTEHPLEPTLGPELGSLYGRLHEDRGVARHRGDVVEFTGESGRVKGVELADGTHLEADLVVMGVGVTPNVGIASAAGIEMRSRDLGGGIAVDGTLRTSAPDVFAAGDIASVPSPHYGRPLRVEHWAVAQDTGTHAGRAMLGDDATYDVLPYFFSDQYDVGMEYKGFVDLRAGGADLVVSGSTDDRELVAFWLRDGEVQAGMAVNVWDRMDDVEELIRSRRQVPRAELEAFTG